MGKIKAKGQFHQIKNEDTGVSSTDSQDYTDHTVESLRNIVKYVVKYPIREGKPEVLVVG